jgi:hypothetical protein
VCFWPLPLCVPAGLSCLVRPGFFLSFYFWLDTVAVLSLAFELPALRAVLLLGETQVGACRAGGYKEQTCLQGAGVGVSRVSLWKWTQCAQASSVDTVQGSVRRQASLRMSLLLVSG